MSELVCGRYDVVVVGGGYNGFIVVVYFVWVGCSVFVLE